MADVRGTTVIHSNHGFFMFDGKVVGRARNIRLSLDGASDEFYEVGSAWLQDMEVINRKVTVEIERGAIDFELLAYAVGVQAQLDIASGTTSFKETGANGLQYDLIIDEGSSNLLSASPNGGGTQILTSPFVLDLVIAANKVVSPDSVTSYFVTARNCKIVTHGLTVPTNAYWTTNMSLVGNQVALGGIQHSIT